MSVSLRRVTDGDRAFLARVYASTREEELKLVDWSADDKQRFVEQQFAAQDAYYREHYDGATLDVVEVDGEAAGRLYVHRGRSDIRIMDIAMAPAYRGLGIATGLLRELIEEASESGRRLSIHVEQSNPARRLYERLGFEPAGEHGVYLLYVKTAS